MKRTLRIAATGFVEAGAGSVASANALLLRELLLLGHQVTFFSKPSFVDPRPLFAAGAPGSKNFSFVDCTNSTADSLRRHLAGTPVLGLLARFLDTRTYQRLLLRSMSHAQEATKFDVILWMGEIAPGRVRDLPCVSFSQGPPGTDARSILRRWEELRALTPWAAAWKWRVLAWLRLSRIGLPCFAASDVIVVGSSQSARTLHELYHLPASGLASIPYPMDLEHFRVPHADPDDKPTEELRILWLGRIIPRKRLDLFLDGAALAIRQGIKVRISIVGGAPMFPGYLRLIENFPFPGLLSYREFVDRERVPALLADHDVLVQPSEEEDFGSSVAEAQACGIPAVVGRSNGNSDYLSEQDIHLADDSPESLAQAFAELAKRSPGEREAGRIAARAFAEKTYSPQSVARQLESILKHAETRKKVAAK